MKKLFVLMAGFAAITLAFLFAMSVYSFAAGGPQGPPHTNPENGDMFTTGCAQKETGNFRVADCDLDTGEGCLNSERCVQFPGVKMSCPSLIGGGYLVRPPFPPSGVILESRKYFTPFFAGNFLSDSGFPGAMQSVERGCSFKNLNVLQNNEFSPGYNDDTRRTLVYRFEVNEDAGPIRPGDLQCRTVGERPGGIQGCTDLFNCVDVNPGDKIALSLDNLGPGDAERTTYKYTVEIDCCLCCDGNPPDEYGNCVRETPLPPLPR